MRQSERLLLFGANTSASGADAPPVNTVLPDISGSTTQGSTLTTSDGTWTGSATITFSYQWKSNGSNVGSDANTYVTQLTDIGNIIVVVVTGTNSIDSSAATSADFGPVVAIPSIGGFVLREDASYVLREDGFKIEREAAAGDELPFFTILF